MNNHRDAELAGLLATLDVPEHRPGFWDELEEQLAVTPLPPGRRLRPGRHGRHGRPGGRFWLAAAVLVLIAGAATVLAVRSTGRDAGRDGDEIVLTAGLVAEQVTDRMATLRSLRGTLEVVDATGAAQYRFWRTSDGSYRIEYPDGEITVLDNRTGTLMTSMLTQTGVPLGPPDVGGFSGAGLLEEDVVTALQAARANPEATVRDDELDGRPVWVVAMPVTANVLADGSVDGLELVVDQETRLPLRVTKLAGESVVQEARFGDLVVDGEIPAGTFTREQPGAVEERDLGFRRAGSPADAGTSAGHAAPVPSAVPEGFALAAVGWAGEAPPTGPEAGNPPSVDVITLLYTRGFEWFVVTTRRAEVDGYPLIWDDPFGMEGIPRDPEQVELAAGRFAGTVAERSLALPAVPHLWGIGDGLVLTVAGNLTADELVTVAESIP